MYQNNFFRVGRPSNQKRDSATPMFSLRKNDSPNVTQSSRFQSIEKSQDQPDFQNEYEALKKSYQRLLEENMTLKSEKSLNFGDNSVSTVVFDRENDPQIQNYAGEVEQLYQQISDSQDHIQQLLNSCSETHSEYLELKQQQSHLKFTQDLQEYTKSVKINLVIVTQLQETLNKKIEEIKLMTRDKKRIESALKETEITRKELEGEIKVKEAKLKTLELSADPETLNIADLYYKLSLASSALAISEKKAAKYDRYIQTNFKDKH